MTARDLRAACAPTTATIRDALEVVDRSGNLVCLLVDADNRLAGLLTDGDLRRAFLKGTSLDDLALDQPQQGRRQGELDTAVRDPELLADRRETR